MRTKPRIPCSWLALARKQSAPRYLASIKISRTKAGDQIIDVKFYDKLRAREDMARHHGVFKEQRQQEPRYIPLTQDDLKCRVSRRR
jgi:hypothetical protein